ncbi:MAG: DUF6452 family protein [Lutibacter sp.]|jgi:hypothetical protein
MKKYITLLIILSFTLINCEKDDICVEAITPKLIVVFYNDSIPANKKAVDSLTVWAEDNVNVYENKSGDSIAIPLDLTQNSTTYQLKVGTKIDTLNFTYDRKDVFVSRSCGYKTIFENFKIESRTANWIKNDTIKTTTIDNETAAHITIYH